MPSNSLRERIEDLREWYLDQRFREKLNDNPQYMIIGASVLLLLCLCLIVCQMTGGGPGGPIEIKYVYYDETNKVIKIVEHNGLGAPSSPLEGTEDVYMTQIYHCEECPEGALKDGMTLQELEAEGMFIGFLMRDNENAEAEGSFSGGDAYSYRAVGGKKWVDGMSQDVTKIVNAPYSKCPKAKPCRPK